MKLYIEPPPPDRNKLLCFMKIENVIWDGNIKNKIRTIYNYKHCIAVDLILKHNQTGTMLGRVRYMLFIQLTLSVLVTSHEEVSWPLPQAREIQICFYFKHDFWRLRMEINFLY